MLHLQRSIPFPPIRLERLVKYLQLVSQRGSSPLEDLRSEGLDFGKGKGDITRFLERLGLVKTSDKSASLTEAAYELLTLYHSLGPAIFHALFYISLVQYKILADILAERKALGLDELYEELNKRIAEISPSSWVNHVAFKSLIAIAQDVGLVEKRGGQVEYRGNPLRKALSETLGGISLGGKVYSDGVPGWLTQCSKAQGPLGVVQIDLECAERSLEEHLANLLSASQRRRASTDE